MAFSKGRATISLSDIDEGSLVSTYLGVNKIPSLICSPLRKDKNPSLGLFSPDGKKVYWTDFGTKEKGSIYDLLALMWHCSFKEVLERISREYTHLKLLKIQKNSQIIKSYAKNNSILQCRIREWRKYDIEYWESYGISLDWLKYAEVYPISHKIIIKNNKRYVMGADKYAYAFVEHKENNLTIKIYQPFNKKGFKWANKHDRSVISLWTKIPDKGDKLVICSSLKDALCLWANTGVPAIATQGEGYSMSDTAIRQLKDRYKEIYILFDNDKAGLEDGIKLANSTGFKNIILPQFDGGKDVSDLFKTKGINEFIKTMNNLLNIDK